MPSDPVVQEIRDRTDIVALIGEVVPLKRAGANYKGRCPFHEEKTPSFNVNPARQIFHCFGCGEGGDAFKFLMRLEGMNFPDALRRLADRAGIQLPEREQSVRARSEEERARARRDRLIEVNAVATEFFRRMLEAPEGVAAREAIAARGIGKVVADEFRLGFAPASWDALAHHLASRKVSPQEGEELGLLAARKSGGHYDRFRNRLMFPVSDVSGNVIAFSGRDLGSEPDSPKYVNSPETAVYRKGKTLYGLGAARVAIRQSGRAILVEGNFDLLQLRQHGFENVVAPMGTAFTAEQADVLKRYAKEVVLLFDGDGAGRKAARAAWDPLAAAHLGAKIVALPQGEDPDGFLRARGTEALASLLEAAPGLLEHLVERGARESGTSIEARAAAIRELRSAIAKVADPLERDLHLKNLGRAFGLDDRQIRQFVAEPKVPAQAARAVLVELPKAEAELVGAVLDHPDLLSEPEVAGVADLLEHPPLRALWERILAGVRGTALLDDLPESILPWLSGRLVNETYADSKSAHRAFRDTFQKLESRREGRQKRTLEEKLAKAESQGDRREVERLLFELQSLARRRSGK